MRAGHALRAIASPTAAGQAADEAASSAGGPKRPSSRAHARRRAAPSAATASLAPGDDLEQLGRLERQRVARRSPSRPPGRRARARGEDPAAAGSSSESTSSRRSSGARRRSSSSSASASRSASTASRCSPCEPKLRRSRAPARCRRRRGGGRAPVVPRSRSRVEPRLERGRGRRLAVVRELRVVETELAGALGEAGRRAATRLVARCDELARRARRPAPSTASSASRRESPRATRRSAAFAGRAPRRTRPVSAARAGSSAAERPVEVRAPHRGPALDDREPVGREDECRQLAPQLLRRRAPRAVELGALRPRRRERHLHLRTARRRACRADAIAAASAPKRTSCASDPGPRREALRADVQRLEQVRLAGAVRRRPRARARLQRELEPRVRAEVAERELADDQPASRIGMIRYQKSSPSAVIRPGRSGLISFSATSSAATDSMPSRRNSALKPISIGSPV